MAISNLTYDGRIWYTFDEKCDRCGLVMHLVEEVKQTTDPTKSRFYIKHGSVCLECLQKDKDRIEWTCLDCGTKMLATNLNEFQYSHAKDCLASCKAGWHHVLCLSRTYRGVCQVTIRGVER